MRYALQYSKAKLVRKLDADSQRDARRYVIWHAREGAISKQVRDHLDKPTLPESMRLPLDSS